MIQANELRIGNWVNSPDVGFVQIESVLPFSVGADGSQYALGIVPLFEELPLASPIKLTPELLEQCGFEYEVETKEGGGFWHKDGAMLYNAGQGEFYNTNDTFMTYLTFVHQLQNWWFANTAEELEINLTTQNKSNAS